MSGPGSGLVAQLARAAVTSDGEEAETEQPSGSLDAVSVDEDFPPFSRCFVVCGRNATREDVWRVFAEAGGGELRPDVQMVRLVLDKRVHSRQIQQQQQQQQQSGGNNSSNQHSTVASLKSNAKTRGAAFVKFSRASAAARAVELLNGTLLASSPHGKGSGMSSDGGSSDSSASPLPRLLKVEIARSAQPRMPATQQHLQRLASGYAALQKLVDPEEIAPRAWLGVATMPATGLSLAEHFQDHDGFVYVLMNVAADDTADDTWVGFVKFDTGTLVPVVFRTLSAFSCSADTLGRGCLQRITVPLPTRAVSVSSTLVSSTAQTCPAPFPAVQRPKNGAAAASQSRNSPSNRRTPA
jgi:hypothetical protein